MLNGKFGNLEYVFIKYMIDKSKKILITWWAGFVWANLVRKLLDLWFSNLYLILREESDTWRIDDILDKMNIYYWSLNDSLFLDECINSVKPDVVYHLAACWVSGKENSMVELFNNNIVWTINLLEACEKPWFDYFVNTWTNFEYWEKKEPFSESDFLEPNNEYAVSKASTTIYCSYIWRSKALPIYTYRLFSVYWPYENSVRLIPSLILNYIDNTAPQLSKPDSVRDFIYVDDVINYYLNVDSIKWDFWWIYNIWSWEQFSIWDVSNIVKRISWSNINPIYWSVPWKRKEFEMYKSNITKMNKTFGIKQRTLVEWLTETYNWFLKNKSLYL